MGVQKYESFVLNRAGSQRQLNDTQSHGTHISEAIQSGIMECTTQHKHASIVFELSSWLSTPAHKNLCALLEAFPMPPSP